VTWILIAFGWATCAGLGYWLVRRSYLINMTSTWEIRDRMALLAAVILVAPMALVVGIMFWFQDHSEWWERPAKW
jgi:uncharacterized membrane protein YbaN (DUF454 family)